MLVSRLHRVTCNRNMLHVVTCFEHLRNHACCAIYLHERLFYKLTMVVLMFAKRFNVRYFTHLSKDMHSCRPEIGLKTVRKYNVNV